MYKRLTFLLSLILLNSCNSNHLNSINSSSNSSSELICEWGTEKIDLCAFSKDEDRVSAIINEMTLDEKIGQMTQSIWHNNVNPRTIREFTIGSIIHTEGPVPGKHPNDWMDKFDQFQRQALKTRLGIPLLIGVDAIHGQNTFDGAVIFPHNIGMAATRNIALIQKAARATALEVVGTGFNWTFSPCIAMPQHEHWGRVYEGFSEDMDFTSAAVQASIDGYQGTDLSSPNTIAATVKHFIADGSTEGGVEGGNAVVDDDTLRNYLLPPYKTAVDKGVAAVMVGFNSVNNINMHQHTHLVTDILKGELNFKGVVMTDWDGGQRFGPAHTVINAGVDIAMQPGNHELFIKDLKTSVENGTVKIGRINDAVRRILSLKFKLGLFNDPYSKREFANYVGSEDHRKIARQAVRESIVLLKNDNNALPILPKDNIVIVGEHANNSGLQSGGWSIHWQGQSENYSGATTIFEGLRDLAIKKNVNIELSTNGCLVESNAKKAIIVVGEKPYAEMFGDTNELELSQEHNQLISDCKDQGKEIIVVLISGRALVIKQPLDLSDAFLAAWLPGSEGAGVADFLFANNNFKPVGKSPYAWPMSVDDLPLSKYDPRALFPYGFGLSDY